jgi:hypothetical protein
MALFQLFGVTLILPPPTANSPSTKLYAEEPLNGNSTCQSLVLLDPLLAK